MGLYGGPKVQRIGANERRDLECQEKKFGVTRNKIVQLRVVRQKIWRDE